MNASPEPTGLPMQHAPNGSLPSLDLRAFHPLPGVRAVAVTLTPEAAAELLRRNTRNRRISETVITKYTAEMQAGEWRLIPAGIGFDENGVLVDGQHRLSAIVRSGQAAPILLVTGLPAASQEKVDRQRKRTLFDALYLAGHATCRQEVEIATCLTRRTLRSESGAVPTDFAVKQTLDCHRESIRAVLKVMMPKKKVRGLCQASFLAASVLYHELDAEKCAEFLEGVRTGVMLTEDHPAMRLRRFLLGETIVKAMPRGGANQSFIFRRAVFAMQAHLEGRMISGLREAEDFTAPRRTAHGVEQLQMDAA